jgi:CDP-diacylglycerol---glycerol-3-phosphate 3-phosphatidyltransferase
MAVAESRSDITRPADDPVPPLDARSLNVPNALTGLRLVLSFVLFWLIDLDGWWRTAAAVFLVAATTDWLDGYYARKYQQITVLGRILDPFVDKIIICGSFIFLQKWPDSGVTAWMTFIILAREMFITSLRSFLEQRGKDFSAQWSGKIKMIVQCVAVPFCLMSLSSEFLGWLAGSALGGTVDAAALFQIRDVILWTTIAVTVYSGVEYTWRAFRMLMPERE